jgi:hypothetical protein
VPCPRADGSPMHTLSGCAHRRGNTATSAPSSTPTVSTT